MRVFGTKQPEATDADRAAATRLSAVAARFKAEPSLDQGETPQESPEEPQEPDDDE